MARIQKTKLVYVERFRQIEACKSYTLKLSSILYMVAGNSLLSVTNSWGIQHGLAVSQNKPAKTQQHPVLSRRLKKQVLTKTSPCPEEPKGPWQQRLPGFLHGWVAPNGAGPAPVPENPMTKVGLCRPSLWGAHGELGALRAQLAQAWKYVGSSSTDRNNQRSICLAVQRVCFVKAAAEALHGQTPPLLSSAEQQDTECQTGFTCEIFIFLIKRCCRETHFQKKYSGPTKMPFTSTERPCNESLRQVEEVEPEIQIALILSKQNYLFPPDRIPELWNKLVRALDKKFKKEKPDTNLHLTNHEASAKRIPGEKALQENGSTSTLLQKSARGCFVAIYICMIVACANNVAAVSGKYTDCKFELATTRTEQGKGGFLHFTKPLHILEIARYASQILLTNSTY
ncbi:hypothetical protein Anapl_04549 [Anas platyrhynchos]|uniref:Uncharacterized protein n=1 Tax=Anas platyrhynchos TaxID=8839 RepID=R0JR29_ANAPL|nr:hypothetical protein Anapl_04549 [Anas platyrhynchos]